MAKTTNVAQAEVKIIRTITDGPAPLRDLLLRLLKPEDFISDSAKEVYRRIRTLYTRGKPIPRGHVLAADPALSEEAVLFLKREAEPVCRKADLEILLEGFLEASRSEQALDITVELAKALEKRDISKALSILSEIQQKLQPDDVDVLTLSLEKDDFGEALETLDKILKGEAISLVPTGLEEFDEKSGGFPRGAVTLIGANTGGGKSTLALNLAANQAEMGYKVLYVSLEMSKEELEARLASRLSRVPFTDIYRGRVTPKQRKHILKSMASFLRRVGNKGGSLKLFVPSKENVSIDDVCAWARGQKFDVIYIDYIGLLRDLSHKKAKWENLGDAVRNAALFAKAAHHGKDKPAMVILVQFDKKQEHVRYSRAMEEHASLLWAWVYDDTAKATHRIKVRQLKTRNQPRYDFWLAENFTYCEMRSVGKGEENVLAEEGDEKPTKETSLPPPPEDLSAWVEAVSEGN